MAARRLREQNKQRNFAQIKKTAKLLFEQKGYEATTTREIAEMAEIGTGTLFLYVRDKVELLLLVYSDAIEEITSEAFATLTEDMSLLDALIHVFAPFFRFYAQHPENARHFLKELLFYPREKGYHQSFKSLNDRFIGRLEHLVQLSQERGEIRHNVDTQQAASSFFAIYFATVTAWLGSFLPSEDAPVDQLRAIFDLQIKGLHP